MIDSPCVNVCHMSLPRGVCVGCCRTLDEIARWSEMSDAERSAVVAQLPGRRIRLHLESNQPNEQRHD